MSVTCIPALERRVSIIARHRLRVACGEVHLERESGRQVCGSKVTYWKYAASGSSHSEFHKVFAVQGKTKTACCFCPDGDAPGACVLREGENPQASYQDTKRGTVENAMVLWYVGWGGRRGRGD